MDFKKNVEHHPSIVPAVGLRWILVFIKIHQYIAIKVIQNSLWWIVKLAFLKPCNCLITTCWISEEITYHILHMHRLLIVSLNVPRSTQYLDISSVWFFLLGWFLNQSSSGFVEELWIWYFYLLWIMRFISFSVYCNGLWAFL